MKGHQGEPGPYPGSVGGGAGQRGQGQGRVQRHHREVQAGQWPENDKAFLAIICFN